MDNYPCDEEDCPVHPTYLRLEKEAAEEKARLEREERDRQRAMISPNNPLVVNPDGTISYRGMVIQNNGNVLIGGNIVTSGGLTLSAVNGNYYTKSYVDNAIIGTNTSGHYMNIGCGVSIRMECMVCKHFKGFDMKETIIIDGAKKALGSK